MMTWGGGNWSDAIGVGGNQKPWWRNMGLPDTTDLGNEGQGVGFVIPRTVRRRFGMAMGKS